MLWFDAECSCRLPSGLIGKPSGFQAEWPQSRVVPSQFSPECFYPVGVSDVLIGRSDPIGESGFCKDCMFCLRVIFISECPISVSECATLSEYLSFAMFGGSVSELF